MTKTPGGLALAKIVCAGLVDKKAEDLCVLDVTGVSSITDFMVIATATSEPHLRALRVELEELVDAANAYIVGVEAPHGSGWIVFDTFDVMVHLFLPEQRTRYRLETLWRDAAEVDVNKLLNSKALPKKGVSKPKGTSRSIKRTVRRK